jgi:hypothetical protein
MTRLFEPWQDGGEMSGAANLAPAEQRDCDALARPVLVAGKITDATVQRFVPMTTSLPVSTAWPCASAVRRAAQGTRVFEIVRRPRRCA